MMFYAFSVFSVIGGLCAAELTFPANTCKRNSDDYSTCLKLAIEESWPRFVEGLPEFDFPRLDPLVFKFGKAVYNNGQVHGEIAFFNMSGVGLAKANFVAVRPHFLDDVFRLEIEVRISRLVLNGEINAVGTLGGFRMSGKGHINAIANDIRGIWDIRGPVINDTWIAEHFINGPSIGNLKVSFNDLFGDSKELNDLVMMFVNEYWPSVYRAMLPTMIEAWDPWLTDLCNRLFSKVPFSKVFP